MRKILEQIGEVRSTSLSDLSLIVASRDNTRKIHESVGKGNDTTDKLNNLMLKLRMRVKSHCENDTLIDKIDELEEMMGTTAVEYLGIISGKQKFDLPEYRKFQNYMNQ